MSTLDPLLKALREGTGPAERRGALRQAGLGVAGIGSLIDAAEAHRGSDPESAGRYARAAVVAARVNQDAQLGYRARCALADVDIVRGHPLRSLRLLRSVPAAGLTPEQALIRAITLIQTLSILGRRAEALEICDRAVEQLGAEAPQSHLGLLVAAKAHVHGSADEHAEALACLDEAVLLLADDPDQDRLLSLQVNRATSMRALDRDADAEDLFRRVLPALEERGSHALLRWARLNLTEIDIQRGAFQDALRALRDLRGEYEALGEARKIADCNLREAEVNLALLLPAQALDHAKRAQAILADIGGEEEQASAAYYRGVAERALGRPPEARRLIAEAHQVLGRPGGRRGLAALCLQRLSELDHARGRYRQAAIQGQAAISQLRALGWHERAARAEASLARLEVDACEPLTAQRRLDDLLSGPLAPRTPWVRLDVHHERARIAEVLGNRRDALRHILAATAILERYRVGVPPDEYMAAFLTGRADVFSDAVRIVLGSGGRRAKERAFELSEQARARALLDLLRTTARERASGRTPLHREVTALEREVDGQVAHGGSALRSDDPEKAAQRAQLLTDRESRLRACLDRLAVHHPEDVRSHRATPIRLQEVVAGLPKDEILVEYYVSTRSLHIFMVKDGELTHVRKAIGREDLRLILCRLRFQLDRSSIDRHYEEHAQPPLLASASAALEELDQLLLGELRPHLDARRIVFIPHDGLHCVPFSALERDGEPLIAKAEVVVAPSAAVYLHCMRAPTATGPALLMGYDDEYAPQIHDEINALAPLLGTHRAFVGQEAGVEVLRRYAPDARIIHIATHADYGWQDSMASRLQFADGWLTVPQVYAMQLAPELLVLSSCATGQVTVTRGGELFGLVRGFLHAGASSILSSLWSVSDRTTREYMEFFYLAFGQGMGPAAAARQATLEMRELHPHPYHWAPFTLTGRGGSSSEDDAG